VVPLVCPYPECLDINACVDGKTSSVQCLLHFQRSHPEVLRGLRGRFVLSINDVLEIREMFAWAHIKEVRTTYTISSHGSKPAGVLIISTP